MTPARSRHNAFHDFAENDAAPAPQEKPTRPARPTAGSEIPAADGMPALERIERLRPSQIMPDRFQPRRLLPTVLRMPFFKGEINCYQAAEQWLALTHHDVGLQNEVNLLLAMGSSFDEHGQIKPITGSWIQGPSGEFVFQIETGERRFWAACLQYVTQQGSAEPQLRVEAVKKPTRQRQVLENQHAEAPSAVSRSCEVASLILAELNINPPAESKDEFEYFRQARRQSMTTALWDRLTQIMQLTRPRMIQLLNILTLPTPLLDLADRYRLPERVLREILSAPAIQWETLIRRAAQSNLTSDQVAEMTNKPRATAKNKSSVGMHEIETGQTALSAVKRFIYLMDAIDPEMQSSVLDTLANDLVANGRAEGLINLMGDLGERIQIRLEGRETRRRG